MSNVLLLAFVFNSVFFRDHISPWLISNDQFLRASAPQRQQLISIRPEFSQQEPPLT